MTTDIPALDRVFEDAGLVLLGALAVWTVFAVAGSRVPRRIHLPVGLARFVSLYSFVTAVTASASAAPGRPDSSPPSGSSRSPDAPWSSARGYPPPRLLARAGGPRLHSASDAAPSADGFTAPSPLSDETPASDPIDPDRRGGTRPEPRTAPPTRLFPRAGGSIDRADAIRRHPAGKGLHPKNGARCPERHVVVEGDTLWGVAATILRTGDPQRIARYWPRLHRANRAVIGPDPSLLLPGQVLEIPPECS